jgi:hypothetical protein
MDCPVCGYAKEPFETACPRCARRARQPCENCRRPGVVAKCRECGRAICAVCAVKVEQGYLCVVCAPANLAAQHEAEVVTAEGERPLPGPGFVREVSLPGYAGLWGEVRRGWVFMREALGMAFRDKDLLIPPLLSVICSLAFVVGALLVVRELGLWEEFVSEEKGWNATKVVGGLVIGFGAYAISYFFTGMTVHLINVHLRGRDAQLGNAFRDALRNLGGLLLLAGASAVISLLTSRRRRRGSYGFDDFATAAVDRVWTVAVYLFLPIIILEDVSLPKAVGRAKEIHARNLVPIAMAEVGVLMVNHIIGFLGLLPAAAGVAYTWMALPELFLPALVAAGLWLILLIAYTGFVRTAYYTCLYLWAIERAEAKELASAPRPLAAALAA